MRLSQVRVQQTTILTITHKTSLDQVSQEIQKKYSPVITTLALNHCTLEKQLVVPPTIQTLSIRNTHIDFPSICGSSLKIVEMPSCSLLVVPDIKGNLVKLNLNHNYIEEVRKIPCGETLKLLDIRDNRIKKIPREMF